jgi:arylsulfatase A-like enzyme
LNGIHVGNVGFARDSSYSELRFNRGLQPGENRIEVIPKPKTGGPPPGAPLLHVDYIRISSENVAHETSMTTLASPLDELAAGPDALRLPEGGLLSFNLILPHRSYLVISTLGDPATSGQLEVVVETDGRELIQTVFEPSREGGSQFLSLDHLSGEAATVSFRAVMDDVLIQKAELVRDVAYDPVLPSRSPVRNALLIVIDTLRADRLKTFNRFSKVGARYLEALARESSVFHRAFAQSNWTKPSVATILSGLFPTAHGANTHKAKLSSAVTTLPEILRRQGFSTIALVANGYISSRFGLENGWDSFKNYASQGIPGRARFLVKDLLRWMKKRDRDGRFFAYLHTVDPHAPYSSPKQFWSPYDHRAYRGIVRPRKTAALLNSIRAGELVLGRRDIRRLNALYNGEITYHDQMIGQLIQEMKRLGIFEDTVVVITSDHGEEFLEHGSAGHGHSMFEELLHVPLIVRLPDGHAVSHRHVDTVVGHVDIAPTLCDLLGTKCMDHIPGESMVPLLNGKSAHHIEHTRVAEFPSGRQYALRSARFKTIFRGFESELFDLFTDPNETKNTSEDYPIARSVFVDELGDHIARVERRQRSIHSVEADGETLIDDTTRAQLEAMGYLGD